MLAQVREVEHELVMILQSVNELTDFHSLVLYQPQHQAQGAGIPNRHGVEIRRSGKEVVTEIGTPGREFLEIFQRLVQLLKRVPPEFPNHHCD